jgi:hypothetical protein
MRPTAVVARLWRSSVWAALLAAPAGAQFVNRAVWLGDERDPFRRDYRQDEEYFLDRSAVVDRPPWWPREAFGDRIEVAAGSVSSRELTVEAAADVGVELGRGLTGRFHYLQSEHQSTRFERFVFGLDAGPLFAQIEGTVEKSRADLSLGVALSDGERSTHRLGVTFVDFPQGKSDELTYERRPIGLGLAGSLGSARGFELAYELGVQLPFDERRLDAGELLSLRRTILGVEARAPLGERDRLFLGLEGEWTAKALEVASGAPLEDADVSLARLRGEWWRRGAHGREFALGAWFLGLDEDYGAPPDPDAAGATRRREWMLSTRVRLPLNAGWSLEPYVVGGHVELETAGTQQALDGDDFRGFQGRCGAPLGFDLSDHARLRIDLSLQLDEPAFGGAAVQFAASF